jgi:hypothetical protein
VGGFDLAVNEVKSPLLEARDKGDQGGLGCIRDRGKHRFAEEGASEGYAVETTDEFPILPDFYGVGETEVVEGAIGLPNLCRDPGAILSGAGPLAGGDNLSEGLVDGNPQNPLLQELFHTPRDAQFVRKEDKTGIRRPPEDGFAVTIPREDPLPVGRKQALRRKVTADGEKTALRGMVDRGKDNGLRESINRHG